MPLVFLSRGTSRQTTIPFHDYDRWSKCFVYHHIIDRCITFHEMKHPLSLYSILSVSLELIFSFLPGLDYSSPVRIFPPSRKILVNGVILLYFHLCSWSFIVSLTSSCFLSQNLCILSVYLSVLFHRSLEFL